MCVNGAIRIQKCCTCIVVSVYIAAMGLHSSAFMLGGVLYVHCVGIWHSPAG